MRFARPRILVLSLLAAVALASPGPGGAPFAERMAAPADPLRYYDRSGEGIRLYWQGKWKEAEQALEEATRAYPSDGLMWLYLGLTKHTLRKPKEAIECYERADELHTEVAAWYLDRVLAQAYLEAGDKENAYRSLERLVFEEGYFNRQGLYDKKPFEPLRGEPRFQKLVGHIDASKMSRTAGWRRDIDLIVAEIKRANPDYRYRDLPPDFSARYRRVWRDVPKLSNDEIYVGLVHMVAALKQGHTSIHLRPNGKVERSILPVDFYAFPESVFVIVADEENKDLLGCELLAVEGVATGKLLGRLEEYAPVESRMEVLTQTMWAMRSLPMLRGLGILKGGEGKVRLTLRTRDGKEIERRVGAVPMPTSINRKLAPPPTATPPLSFRNLKREHWFESLPGHDATFVQVNQMMDAKDETLPQFGLKLRKALDEGKGKNVILDIRHNNGGTTALYPELLRTLIAHTTQEGNRLYVIIGRGVYSATANFVTDLERLAKPIFVGEPTSGTGNQNGDSTYIVLPYSGLGSQTTSARWQLNTPWDRRRSLMPDIPVQLTAKAYYEGRDPALEVILLDLKRPPRPGVPIFP